jgi:hypothetical protein
VSRFFSSSYLGDLFELQTGSVPHPTSYPLGTGGGALSPGLKRQELEADHSASSSAEVKKTWIYTPTPIRLHGVVLN